MRDSDELRTMLVDYWAALSGGNIAFVQEHLSNDAGVLGIGTDPDEWYQGDRLHQVWREQLAAAGRVTITPGDVLAFAEGTVGWLADRPTFTFPDGSVFRARFTAVAHLERDVWKLVQSHTSVAVDNQDLVRTPLPT